MTQARQQYNKMIYISLAWPSDNYALLLQQHNLNYT